MTPFLAGAVLAAALAGLPLLVRHMRAAPVLEQSIVVACCVAFGSGFAAVLGVLAALVGAPAVAVACTVMIAASGLLLSRRDLLDAVGLCLLAASGVWAVAEEAVTTLFLVPAMLFWLAASLIRIAAPCEPADQAWPPSEKVTSQVVRAAAVMK
jgi:hypothetical protein